MLENLPLPPDESDVYQRIATSLEEQGWCVTAQFIPPLLVNQLAHEARVDWEAGQFRHAGIGRGADLQVRPEIRNDRVNWLDPANCSGAQRRYLNQLELLRRAINRTLYLGLFDYEGHLAIYPTGGFYRTHLDRFQNNSRRTVSTVLYLNNTWTEDDGGQLRLYTHATQPERHVDVLPIGGSLVSFLSDRFPHEVLPTGRDRLSLPGWFRTRDSTIF